MGTAQSKHNAISECVIDFTLDLYREVAKNDMSNVFLSPCSVFVVMAMLRAGAMASTQEQINMSLKLYDISEEVLENDLKLFSDTFSRKRTSVTLHAANRLYPSKKHGIKEEFSAKVQTVFGATVSPLDFDSNPKSSRHEINRWIERQTENRIVDLIPHGSINEDSRIIVVNAIYFKGKWLTPFELLDTRSEDFHVTRDRKVKVEMMHNVFDNVPYLDCRNLNCKLLELFYEGEEIGAVILLPNDIDGLKNLEVRLNFNNLQTAVREAYSTKVTVALPKFKFDMAVELNDALKALGINDAFDFKKADFTGMGERLNISRVFHKAVVDLNEEGTEAAASTAVVVEEVGSSPYSKKIRFIADHPFLFLIWDHKLNCPLFIGRFMGAE